MSADIGRVEDWLRRHAGLEAASLGPGTVARAARDRMEELACPGVDAYLTRLATEAGERQTLIDRVIVPETWFFRDRAALDAIAKHVVETWGPAHPGATFRALSVPCSTGEEPYSLAMALAMAGWPLARVRIEAVDISATNLVRAQAGVYGKNSFRGSDLAFREMFLSAAGADMWRLNEAVRAAVTLVNGNLLAEDFATGRGVYDAVLCRNLLIYFSRETQARAVGVLGRMMAPGAWLAVGPAEAVLLLELGFSALRVAGGFLMHKPAPVPAPVAVAPQVPRRAWVAAAVPARGAVAKPVTRLPAAEAKVDADASVTIEGLRQLADAGRLREAAAQGERLLARDGASPELMFLLAVVAQADGDARRAEEFFRKAVYLDPRHAEALAHLALVAEKNGDLRAARSLRQRAQRALEKEAV
jgi:chemotaxis protein methyltransferase WspC